MATRNTRHSAVGEARVLFRAGDPKSRYISMVNSVDALYRAKPRQYTAIACLIGCYLDAIAARGGRARKGKFLKFLRANLSQLCLGLRGSTPGLDGAEVFYKFFRSGLVHTFFARSSKYAIAEDAELLHAYAGQVRSASTIYTAVNVDRLYKDFRALAKRKAKGNRL